MNNRRRNGPKSGDDAARSPTKAGWRVGEWAEDTGFSRSYVYLLLDRGEITSVKAGTMRIITTPPADYLARLAAEQQSTPRPGSGVNGAAAAQPGAA